MLDDDALVRINGVLVRAADAVVSVIDDGLDLVDGRQIDAPDPRPYPRRPPWLSSCPGTSTPRCPRVQIRSSERGRLAPGPEYVLPYPGSVVNSGVSSPPI
jgi:hypothetical protein